MPSTAQIRSALAALREEFARRAAHEAAIAAENSTKYTRDITKAPAYVERAWAPAQLEQLAVPREQAMLQGMYRGYAGDEPVSINAAELFVTPQQRVADYYAKKRAAQTGEAPHAEMVLIDPNTGRVYGHSTMGSGSQEPMYTNARKIRPEAVVDRTQLYARGGLAHYKECSCGR
jgi:hypothetical protein